MELLGQSPAEVTDLTQILVHRYHMAAGDEFTWHQHRHHQLSWAPDGILAAETEGSSWALPPSVALWIPSEAPHAVRVERKTTFHNLCFLPERCPITWRVPTVVPVGGLLHALFVHLTHLELAEPERCRAESVVFDLVGASPLATSAVPLPTDDRALDVVRLLLADPSDNRTLDQLGRSVGASRRTLARKFVSETGLTFSEWRTQLRIAAAKDYLVAGVSTSATARRVGYRDVSTFIVMFQRATGHTPGTYAAQRRRVS